MYALLPALFLWLRRAASLRAALTGWFVAALIAVGEYCLRGGGQELESRLLTRYFPCFMGGLLAWQLLKRCSPRFPGWSWPIYLLAVIASYRFLWAIKAFGFSSVLHWSRMRGPRLQHTWPPYVDLIVEGILCACVGLSIPRFQQIRSRWFKTASKLIARYSYGIYLSHSPVIWLCFGIFNTGSKALNLTASLLVTAALSIAAYHLLEDPCIQLGKRISTKCFAAS